MVTLCHFYFIFKCQNGNFDVVKLESFGRVFDFILGIASGIYIYIIAWCLSFRNPVPPPTQAF